MSPSVCAIGGWVYSIVSGPNVSFPLVVYVSVGSPAGGSASMVRPIAGFSNVVLSRFFTFSWAMIRTLFLPTYSLLPV